MEHGRQDASKVYVPAAPLGGRVRVFFKLVT
jgi:hypothetical protein